METLIFPIIVRIGNKFEFGVDDLYAIIREVNEGVKDLDIHSVIDAELLYVEKYSEHKIAELMKG